MVACIGLLLKLTKHNWRCQSKTTPADTMEDLSDLPYRQYKAKQNFQDTTRKMGQLSPKFTWVNIDGQIIID